MKKLQYCLMITMIIAMASCKSSQSSMGTFYEFETYCIGTEMDGSVTLRAWGEGNSKKDAIEQAKKKAVHDIMFKNNIKGLDGYMSKPLVLEVNGEEKHQDYFNQFFADRGAYTQFVNFKDEKSNSKQKLGNRQVYKYGVTVRVLRNALKQKLQTDGIIK